MKVFFYTFGCKVNQYETAALAGLFSQNGFEICDDEQQADIVVINSCSVTESGDRKSLRRLRQAKAAGRVTVLCGCFPQAFPEKAAQVPEADIVAGNTRRSELPGLVKEFIEKQRRTVDIFPHSEGEQIEPLGVSQPSGRTRAYLKVEDGCNRFCAYCVVPYARGRVRSLPVNEIKQSAASLAAAGYKELVLTGINLSCYGQDIGLNVADAAEAALVPGIERLRFGSLEPDLLNDGIISRLAAIPNLCAHFHLALQSGCDNTLKAMRRRYNTQQYLIVADKLRRAFDSPSFTTDVIVGFPGESERDFEQSAEFVSSFGFLKCHIFPYSRRSGTAAAELPGQLPRPVKEERARRLTELCAPSRDKLMREAVGKSVRVIAEHPGADGRLTGMTDRYFPAIITRPSVAIGECASFKVVGLENNHLIVE